MHAHTQDPKTVIAEAMASLISLQLSVLMSETLE